MSEICNQEGTIKAMQGDIAELKQDMKKANDFSAEAKTSFKYVAESMDRLSNSIEKQSNITNSLLQSQREHEAAVRERNKFEKENEIKKAVEEARLRQKRESRNSWIKWGIGISLTLAGLVYTFTTGLMKIQELKKENVEVVEENKKLNYEHKQ